MKQMRQLTLRTIPALLLATFSGATLASGFALQNQTGSGNGNAFAGAAAAAEDAGTIFFNPAGMTNLPEGTNLSLAGTYLNRKIKFSDSGTAARTLTITPPGVTVPITASQSNGGDAGGGALIPAGYVSMSLSKDLRLGVGISPTFGNKTEYSEDFVGRFSGYFADMQQININPSVAYQLNSNVSLGVGLNYASNETHFMFKLPTGTTTQTTVDVKGDDTSYGYNFGAMFKLSDSTRLGASYRSSIKFDLEGNFAITGVSTTPATVKLETPASASLAVSHKVSDRIELLGDYTWTGWSSVKTLDVKNASTGATIQSLSYNFKDTWRVGLGANYQLNDQWKLRAGVALDKSPVQSAADRTMTLPDSDRTWLSFGAKFALSKANSLDVGYTHIFFKDASTERAVAATQLSGTTVANAQTVKGTFDTSVDILSLQYNHNF